MYIFSKIITFTLLLGLAAFAAIAQTGQSQEAQVTDSTEIHAAKTGPIKPFSEFFKDKTVVSDSGLFIIHRADHQYYFEIPDSLLKRR